MSMNHSTTKTVRSKPSKPRPDFPLTPHPAGYWCKKIRGKLHYFGPWEDPDGALKKYLAMKDDLHSGRTPRPDVDELTVKALCNKFLNQKKSLMENGELSPRTWDDYQSTCKEILAVFGKQRLVSDLVADDFTKLRTKVAKKWGAHRLGKTIQCVRSVFKFGYDAELIDRPIRFGPGFKRPSKKTLRLHRAEKGKKLFTPAQLRAMIRKAEQPLKATLLLGINCGFGNSDCGTLPIKALDLPRGWVDYPRPKTGIERRCPLWPETVAALREALADRPQPKDPANAELVFITKYGGSWAKNTCDNPISKETAKLLKSLKLHRGKGLNFYALRHCFETIGGEAKDQVAVDHIMGHARDDMASVYRERISDERLKAVSDFVRTWLFGKAKVEKPERSR